jgi:hypothetical protein
MPVEKIGMGCVDVACLHAGMLTFQTRHYMKNGAGSRDHVRNQLETGFHGFLEKANYNTIESFLQRRKSSKGLLKERSHPSASA